MPAESTPLRTTLSVNATFSAVSGVGLIAISRPLGRLADLPAPLVAAVGAALLPFAAFVWLAARRDHIDPQAARVIAFADFAWVAAAVLLIALPGTMAAAGKLLLGGLSVVVLGLGLAEAKALSLDAGAPQTAVTEGTAPSA